MGTWGPSIFSNDVACDIRTAFRELIGSGLSAEEATQRTEVLFGEAFNSEVDGKIAEIALAMTQWQCGRLLPGVRDAAIRAIDAGADLELWTDHSLRRARKAALEKARRTLQTPQRQPVKLSRPMLSISPYLVGDVLTYKPNGSQEWAFRVIKNESEKHAIGEAILPRFQILTIGDPDLPDFAGIVSDRQMTFLPPGGQRRTIQFTLLDAENAPSEGWRLIGNNPLTDQEPLPPERSGVFYAKRPRSKADRNLHIDVALGMWLTWTPA